MHPTAAVEVEVVVPCTEGQEHPIRLRIVSWEQWEVAYTPCEALLGRAFGLMAPCSHYVRENRDELKEAVVQQLARVGAPAVPALTQALGDTDRDVRRAAAEALGRIGDTQAVPALIQALGDERYDVRRAAAWALGQIGDASAVPALIKALRDDFSSVRSTAAKALVRIGDTSAVSALIRELPNIDWGERSETICELGGADLPAVPAFIQALEDGNWVVRRAAAKALGGLVPRKPFLQSRNCC